MAVEIRKQSAVRISLNHLSNSLPLSLKLCSLLGLRPLGLNLANSAVSFMALVSLTWGGVEIYSNANPTFQTTENTCECLTSVWISTKGQLLPWGNSRVLTPLVYINNWTLLAFLVNADCATQATDSLHESFTKNVQRFKSKINSIHLGPSNK